MLSGTLFQLLSIVWLIGGPVVLALLWRKLQEVEQRERSIRQEIARVRREMESARGAAAETSGRSQSDRAAQARRQEDAAAAFLSEPTGREQGASQQSPLPPAAAGMHATDEPALPPAPALRPEEDIWLTDDLPAGASRPPRPAVSATSRRPSALDDARAIVERQSRDLRETLGSTPSLEEILAGRWLTWVGALALIIGVGFFFRYSIEQELIGETGRVALGILAGVLGFAGGWWLMQRDYRFLSQGLVAAAAGTLYFSLYFAAMQYHLVPIPLAFVAMVAVTASLLTFAGLYNAQPSAVLGLIGGFLTPLMLSTGSGNFFVLFSYLLILDAGVLVLATWRNWGGARVVAFLGTLLLWLGWLAGQYHSRDLLQTIGMMSVFFGLFVAIGVWHTLYRLRQPQQADYFLMLFTPLVYFTGLYVLTLDEYAHLHGLLAILLTVLYGGLAVVARMSHPAGRSVVLAFGGIGALFSTLAVPLQLTGHWITIAWAGEALLLVELGLRYREQDLRKAGFALLILVQLILAIYVGQTLDNPRRTMMKHPPRPGVAVAAQTVEHSTSWTRIFNGRSFSFLASAMVLGVLAWEYRRRSTGQLFVEDGDLIGKSDAATPDEQPQGTPADTWLFPPGHVAGVLLAGIPLTVMVLLLMETISLGEVRRWLDVTVLSWSLVWVVLAAMATVVLSLRPGPRWLGVPALLVFAGAALLLLAVAGVTFDQWENEFIRAASQAGGTGIWALPLVNPRGIALLVMTIACGAAAWLSQKTGKAIHTTGRPVWNDQLSWTALEPGSEIFTAILGLAAVASGLVMLTVETWAQGVVLNWGESGRALAITLVWTLYATGLLVAGIVLRNKEVRVLALAVFLLTTAKVFLYDVWRVDAAIRTLAFVALGASLLLVSYLYRRHRNRIREFFTESSPQTGG